jgi:hypothetical protein
MHRTVWWVLRGELVALGKRISGVRLKFTGLSGGAPDCPVNQRSSAPTVGRAIFVRCVAAPTVGGGHQTVWCAPDSVRCANRPGAATFVRARKGRRSAPNRLQWLSGGAPNCPVRHSTEGKDGLSCWPPMAPSCLGAIKGTPRRMEELHKHSLSILRHPDFILAHLFHCVWDLSSIRVKDSLRCHLSSSLLSCVRGCAAICVLCVLLIPTLLRAFFVIVIVRARGSNLWRFLTNEKRI